MWPFRLISRFQSGFPVPSLSDANSLEELPDELDTLHAAFPPQAYHSTSPDLLRQRVRVRRLVGCSKMSVGSSALSEMRSEMSGRDHADHLTRVSSCDTIFLLRTVSEEGHPVQTRGLLIFVQ